METYGQRYKRTWPWTAAVCGVVGVITSASSNDGAAAGSLVITVILSAVIMAVVAGSLINLVVAGMVRAKVTQE